MKTPKAGKPKTPDALAVRALIRNSRRRPKRLPTTPYPWGPEREYRKLLRLTLARLTAVTRELILPRLSTWARKDERRDADWEDDLPDTMAGVEAEHEKIFTAGRVAFMAALSALGLTIQSIGRKGFGKQMESLTGVDFQPTESWAPAAVKVWAETNYSLVKNISQKYITDLNRIVSEGLQAGKSVSTLRGEIGKMGARLQGYQIDRLARDQVGKLNSTMSQKRQQEAGFDMYIWSTSMNERVRGNPGGQYPDAIPSHWAMEGKICRWDDPAVYWDGGKWVPRTSEMPIAHPGTEIDCRCVSIPYAEPLQKEEGE